MIKVFKSEYQSADFYAKMGQYFASLDIAKELERQLYNKPNSVWYLSTYKRNILGFAALFDNGKYYFLDNLYVLPEYRNAGTAKEIVSEIVSDHTDKPIKCIANNPYAIKIFSSLGFVEWGGKMANIKSISNIQQAFYRYELWEDFQSGMYNPPSVSSVSTGITSDERIDKAIECLSDKDICRKYMRKVVSEWEISTAEVLTNPESNGRAWLGQCACFMYGGCHDEETRKAWALLSPEVQKAANKVADEVIKEWLTEYAKSCPNYQLTIDDI